MNYLQIVLNIRGRLANSINVRALHYIDDDCRLSAGKYIDSSIREHGACNY